MRILHCVFTHGLFGSERYCADLARRQLAIGHEVHVAVDPRSQVPPLLPAGVTVHRVGRLFRGLRLKTVLGRIRPDIVHAHLSAACKTLGAMSRRPPVVATMHIGFKAHQHGRLDGLIALTTAAADEAARSVGPVERIWNWAPEPPPLPDDARQAARRDLALAPDTFAIGFVGRLHPSKNPQMLVRAYRDAALPNAVLLIVGEGREHDEVAALAAGDPSIRLLGYRNDAARLYRAFDMLAMPSRFEQVPLVLLEAMTAELPVAAASISSIAEFLPSPPARLFASEDATALTAILREEHALGQRRHAWDMEPFDPDLQVAKIMAFYNRAIDERAKP
jgi:glycosyltransferase involved in cell wall biosynthesis